MKSALRITLVVLVALAESASLLSAHDLQGLADKSMQLNKELNVQDLVRLAPPLDPDARYVYSRLLLWDHGQKLRACFYDGTEEEKALVTAAAAKLLDGKNVNISIDFGAGPAFRSCSESGPRSDIRVSFSAGCCSGFIGRTSHLPEVSGGPSVKLQGITKYRRAAGEQKAMHELMHALGFNHEHQSPSVKCEPEFDKDIVLANFGWTDTQYKTNLRPLDEDSHSYTWSSDYDRLSIMKYFFPASFLKRGEQSACYSKENLVPSDRDYDGLRKAYAMNPATTLSRERTRSALGRIDGSGAPKAVVDLAREIVRLNSR